MVPPTTIPRPDVDHRFPACSITRRRHGQDPSPGAHGRAPGCAAMQAPARTRPLHQQEQAHPGDLGPEETGRLRAWGRYQGPPRGSGAGPSRAAPRRQQTRPLRQLLGQHLDRTCPATDKGHRCAEGGSRRLGWRAKNTLYCPGRPRRRHRRPLQGQDFYHRHDQEGNHDRGARWQRQHRKSYSVCRHQAACSPARNR